MKCKKNDEIMVEVPMALLDGILRGNRSMLFALNMLNPEYKANFEKTDFGNLTKWRL